MMWKLTCFYMGRASSENLRELDLRDPWTLVEIGEDIGKHEGRMFDDADDAKAIEDSPLTWKDGQATETGCGPWWSGVGRNTVAPLDTTVAECDELLVQAGLPRLTVVMADGVPDLEATFDTENCGVNYEQLYVLDLAEWRLRPLSARELAALDTEDFLDPDLGDCHVR